MVRNNSSRTHKTTKTTNKKSIKKLPGSHLKKNPNAPRRFKSAYMFFSSYKHKEIRSTLTTPMTTPEIAKMVSKAWKELDDAERAYWEDKAMKDRQRFEVEKNQFNGDWQVPRTRKVKPKDAPKRPMSAFLAFSNSKRGRIREENPGISNSEMSKILAKEWAVLDPAIKQQYIDEELILREDYKVRIALWKQREEEKQQRQRKQREDEALRIALSREAGAVEEDATDLFPVKHDEDSMFPALSHPGRMVEGSDTKGVFSTPPASTQMATGRSAALRPVTHDFVLEPPLPVWGTDKENHEPPVGVVAGGAIRLRYRSPKRMAAAHRRYTSPYRRYCSSLAEETYPAMYVEDAPHPWSEGAAAPHPSTRHAYHYHLAAEDYGHASLLSPAPAASSPSGMLARHSASGSDAAVRPVRRDIFEQHGGVDV